VGAVLKFYEHSQRYSKVKANHRCHGIDENPEQGLICGINDTGDNLSPVTTTPAIIYRRVIDADEQLFAGVVDTGEDANISTNLCKNPKWPL
jgi:hypothetical protein